MEKLESYDFIGAYFAQSILTELALDVQEETVAKIETKEVKQEEAVIALSTGIDAYDKGEEEKAKEELKTVQKLDPVNEVAKFYLSKLQALSPKFRVETVEYATPYNPASLGFIETDKIYIWIGAPFPPPWVEITENGYQMIGEYIVHDNQLTMNVGISLPIGERFGLGAGVLITSVDLYTVTESETDDQLNFEGEWTRGLRSGMSNFGGFISLGAKIFDWFSIGASVLAWYTVHLASPGLSDQLLWGENIVREGLFLSFYPGLMFRGPGGNLTFDVHMAITTQSYYYADFPNKLISLGQLPLVIDGSLTYGLFNQRLFLGLKGVSDIYYDRGGHALRIIPMVEVWPARFLAVRGGYEYSHLSQLGNFTINHGAVAGITIKVWRFDINANLTYRKIPARLLPGASIENMKLLIGIEFNPEWVTR